MSATLVRPRGGATDSQLDERAALPRGGGLGPTDLSVPGTVRWRWVRITVAERLGHENATLVLKTCGQIMPDSEDRTRRAIDDAWTTDGAQTESDHV